MTTTNCAGMEEMIPAKHKNFNAKIKTFSNTYYFAHSTGERKKIREKPREILTEPKKILDRSLAFNSDAKLDLKYRNSIKRLNRRDIKNPMTIYD